jgi:hypothetical protein
MPRQKLKITFIPPFYRVHYLALEGFLACVYRLTNYSVLRAAGATHGLYPEYLVQGVVPRSLRAQAGRIRAGSPCGDLGLILTVLCADGHIPAGQYIIDTRRKPGPLEVYKTLLQETLDPLAPECVQFKERHRKDAHFRKKARVIDQSLIEWLKRERPGGL